MSDLPGTMASRLALGVAKKELRGLMKKRLSDISTESIALQSETVFKKVSQFQKYRDSKRIGIYLSMPNAELQTDAIVRDALSSGKKVFVPYLSKYPNPPPDTPKSVMDMVDIRSISDYTSLKRDSWGIPTIDKATVNQRERILGDKKEEASSEGLDMILLPGVAFDIDTDTGNVRRLGHGKGFYDYFLHRYLENQEGVDTTKVPERDVLLYGLALNEQFLQPESNLSVPVGEWDHRLHGLVIGNGQVIDSSRQTS